MEVFGRKLQTVTDPSAESRRGGAALLHFPVRVFAIWILILALELFTQEKLVANLRQNATEQQKCQGHFNDALWGRFLQERRR